jgi:hypothetical protein
MRKIKNAILKRWSVPFFAASIMVYSSCQTMDETIPQAELRTANTELSKNNAIGKTTTYFGPAVSLGKGVAKAWVETTQDEIPVAVGVNISAKSTAFLDEMKFTNLQFPKQANLTIFNHIGLDFLPMGHEPEKYMVPHFDVHFYMISVDERKSIVAEHQHYTEDFLTNYIPANHFSPGHVVPGMGDHFIDLTSPELHGAPFTSTMIIGAYRNKITFIEPMINRYYLQNLIPNAIDKRPIPQANKVQKTGHYPTSYTISFNPNPGEYRIALTDFIYRVAE